MNFLKFFTENILLTFSLIALLILIAVMASFISEQVAIYSIYVFAPLFTITLFINMIKGAFKPTV